MNTLKKKKRKISLTKNFPIPCSVKNMWRNIKGSNQMCAWSKTDDRRLEERQMIVKTNVRNYKIGPPKECG
jgi:hypothetical protein